MKRWIVLVVVVAAACSSGGKQFADPLHMANALGCEQTYNPEKGAIAPADVATCQFKGEQVTLVVGTNAERDATVKFAHNIAAKFGAKTIGATVEGNGWAAMMETHEVAVAVQAELGGKIS